VSGINVVNPGSAKRVVVRVRIIKDRSGFFME
jgi:hypothetical protein